MRPIMTSTRRSSRRRTALRCASGRASLISAYATLRANYARIPECSTNTHQVRWDMGLNKKRMAFFVFPHYETELRLINGDASLRLRACLTNAITLAEQAMNFSFATQATRHAHLGVVRGWLCASLIRRRCLISPRGTNSGGGCTAPQFADPAVGVSQVGVELRCSADTPVDCSHGFSVDMLWKSIAYDRMQVSHCLGLLFLSSKA